MVVVIVERGNVGIVNIFLVSSAVVEASYIAMSCMKYKKHTHDYFVPEPLLIPQFPLYKEVKR